MAKFEVVFSCKGLLTVFKETVEANDVEHAKLVVRQLVRDAGLKLQRIVSVIQL